MLDGMYSVPTQNLNKLQKRFNHINKKAEKLGVEIVNVVVGEPYHVKMCVDIEGREGMVEFVDIHISGQAVVIGGWQVVGHVQHNLVELADGKKERVNTINVLPAAYDLNFPRKYFSCSPKCDHCHQDRARQQTYILHNKEQCFQLVGSTCIDEYTGANDPHIFASLASSLKLLGNDLDELGNFSFGGAGYGFDALQVLSLTAASIRLMGWTSKGQAYKDNTAYATADHVWNEIGRKESALKSTQGDRDFAEATIKHLKSINLLHANPFILNMVNRVRLPFVQVRDFGILCYAIVYYQKHLAEQAEQGIQFSGKRIGKVGDPMTNFKGLTLIDTKSWDSQFGVQYLYKFVDPANNLLVWRTGTWLEYTAKNDDDPALTLPVQIGDIVELRGKVKAHNNYEGETQTILTRCRLVDVQVLGKVIEQGDDETA